MIDGGNTRIEDNLDKSKGQGQTNEYYAYENEYGPEDTGVELTEIRIKKTKAKK